ncbi:MAG: hypothetical protein KF804_16180 [Burkholderiales bacterium]|jgi:hypothetical protein|nr:hypothetical protein [Burkholderiales bacterium]
MKSLALDVKHSEAEVMLAKLNACDVSGYGMTGPYSKKKADDLRAERSGCGRY